jgi:fructosamine-3-kinase
VAPRLGRLISGLEQVLDARISECAEIAGGPRISHFRLRLADGRAAFAKVVPGHAQAGQAADEPDPRRAASFPAGLDLSAQPMTGGQFEAEARGLGWLAEADAVPVARVLACANWALVTEWVPAEPASAPAAEQFGRELAQLHAARADGFGSAWPGFIAGLTLGDERAESWPEWYAAQRLLPFAALAASQGTLRPDDLALVEAAAAQTAALAGPAEPPSRIHGDCWSGNVLWSGGRCVLIDPAAQGGHRETDLAMLALFGAPQLDRILAGYQEVAPLGPGWRDRVALHQLHPMLVHACLFGTLYRHAVLDRARAVLTAAKSTGQVSG